MAVAISLGLFLSNSTREVESKLTFKCVDENTKWKIYVQVLSIQNVNFHSHAIPTRTQFSHAYAFFCCNLLPIQVKKCILLESVFLWFGRKC